VSCVWPVLGMLLKIFIALYICLQVCPIFLSFYNNGILLILICILSNYIKFIIILNPVQKILKDGHIFIAKSSSFILRISYLK
jgi:hypothetical protein